MLKPDWMDAPWWAQFIAMDADGEWFWYEFGPIADLDAGYWKTRSEMHIRKQAMMGDSDMNWDETLERRPC